MTRRLSACAAVLALCVQKPRCRVLEAWMKHAVLATVMATAIAVGLVAQGAATRALPLPFSFFGVNDIGMYGLRPYI